MQINARVPLADGFVVDTDPSLLNRSRVHEWLSTDAYWALGRSYEAVDQAIDASLNFGVYDRDGEQVGFARLVTDGVTFGWLCDVYVAREVRGRGLGVGLAQAIVEVVRPLRLKRLLLMTSDAHGVYARAGFRPPDESQKFMVLAGAGDQ